MPHILYTFDEQPLTPPETPGVTRFGKMLRKLYEQLARVVNGQLSFGKGVNPDNIAGAWASVTTPATPNTDFIVTHNLFYIPTGFLVMKQSKAGVVYTGSLAWTANQITLRCNVASDDVLIFIL